ncbi:unnamed protein product [Moneuplotes crassus]|uniref:Uncharacterized protein n=1 Tax=Euplotes crassus TaxID=5936 RepID=A0AAD1XGP8_EUPCR|nr:unnamed protein product [Moneuplotes crassus]
MDPSQYQKKIEHERLKRALDSQKSRQKQMKHFEEEKCRKIQELRDHKNEQFRLRKERIMNNKIMQMRRLRNLSQIISKKQKNASIHRNSSDFIVNKKKRDALRTQRFQRNLQIEKQKQMDLKMRVLEKEKLGEYRVAKTKHNQAKAKKALEELLRMKNIDQTHSSSLVGMLERSRHMRHRSMQHVESSS